MHGRVRSYPNVLIITFHLYTAASAAMGPDTGPDVTGPSEIDATTDGAIAVMLSPLLLLVTATAAFI